METKLGFTRMEGGGPMLQQQQSNRFCGVDTARSIVALCVVLTGAGCSDMVTTRGKGAGQTANSEGLSTAVEDMLATGTRPSPANLSMLIKQSRPLAGLHAGECGSVGYFIRSDRSALFFEYPDGQNRPRWADCPSEADCEVGIGSTTLIEHLLRKGEHLRSLEVLRDKSMNGKPLP